MRLTAAWATDVGRVRDGNEDSLLVDERIGVFAVADGMGGHRGGEVASSTAIEAVRVAMAGGATIDEAIRAANTAIRERAYGDDSVAGMGTTFTAVVPLDDASVLIGHVGDSRAYLVRDSRLARLTRDHSLVEDLVRDGSISREQAEVHPRRSVITRALGIESDIEVDLYTVRVAEGDRIVVCSDGLTDMVTEPELLAITGTEPDPSAAANRLVDAANDAGGIDNITVVLLDVAEVEHDGAVFVDPIDAFGDPEPDPVTSTPTSSTSAVDAARRGDADSHPPVAPGARRRARAAGRSTLRVLAFVVPLLLIVGVAGGTIWYRGTHTWFVSTVDGKVVIQRGVPDGLLWMQPTIAERTDLSVGVLTEADRELVSGGSFCETDSLAAARACVDTLKQHRLDEIDATSTTSTASTTSTTLPRPTTATRASASPTTSTARIP